MKEFILQNVVKEMMTLQDSLSKVKRDIEDAIMSDTNLYHQFIKIDWSLLKTMVKTDRL